MIPFLISAVAVCAAYLLYRQGYMVTKCITAVLFLFQTKRTCEMVSVDSCTGWVRHMGRFRECRTYKFSLECRLSKGTVEVSLLDKDKQELLRLDPDSPFGIIELNRKNRYYLRWKFSNATGKCELRW